MSFSSPELTLKSFSMNVIDSCFVILWLLPSLWDFNFLLILNPGRSNVTAASNPNIPISGMYSIPGISIYSLMPKEKFPFVSNFDCGILLSTAFNNCLRRFRAFSPLNVTLHAICSPGLTPQVGILLNVFVFTAFAFEIT